MTIFALIFMLVGIIWVCNNVADPNKMKKSVVVVKPRRMTKYEDYFIDGNTITYFKKLNIKG